MRCRYFSYANPSLSIFFGTGKCYMGTICIHVVVYYFGGDLYFLNKMYTDDKLHYCSCVKNGHEYHLGYIHFCSEL